MDVCCASGEPVRYDYSPLGTIERIGSGDLSSYIIAGTKPGAVILLPDIFGYDEFPQVKQTADRLAAASGFSVAIPDVFRGKAWPMSKFPPKPEDNLMGWITSEGSYEKVSKDVYELVDHFKGCGCAKFAVLGCCWGVSVAMTAGADAGTFSACGGFHPSLFGRDKEFAAAVNVPVALVAAKGDPLEAVKEVLDGRGGDLAGRSAWRRMDDMIHGFCAARGDFKDDLVCKRVAEAVDLVAGFLVSNM